MTLTTFSTSDPNARVYYDLQKGDRVDQIANTTTTRVIQSSFTIDDLGSNLIPEIVYGSTDDEAGTNYSLLLYGTGDISLNYKIEGKIERTLISNIKFYQRPSTIVRENTPYSTTFAQDSTISLFNMIDQINAQLYVTATYIQSTVTGSYLEFSVNDTKNGLILSGLPDSIFLGPSIQSFDNSNNKLYFKFINLNEQTVTYSQGGASSQLYIEPQIQFIQTFIADLNDTFSVTLDFDTKYANDRIEFPVTGDAVIAGLDIVAFTEISYNLFESNFIAVRNYGFTHYTDYSDKEVATLEFVDEIMTSSNFIKPGDVDPFRFVIPAKEELDNLFCTKFKPITAATGNEYINYTISKDGSKLFDASFTALDATNRTNLFDTGSFLTILYGNYHQNATTAPHTDSEYVITFSVPDDQYLEIEYDMRAVKTPDYNENTASPSVVNIIDNTSFTIENSITTDETDYAYIIVPEGTRMNSLYLSRFYAEIEEGQEVQLSITKTINSAPFVVVLSKNLSDANTNILDGITLYDGVYRFSFYVETGRVQSRVSYQITGSLYQINAFGFVLDTTLWNKLGNKLPVINTGGSFTKLQLFDRLTYQYSRTVVEIEFEYTNVSEEDGLSWEAFGYTGADSNNINLYNFNSIPLSGNGSQFKGFRGRITATDTPIVGTNIASIFEDATLTEYGDITSWNISTVADMTAVFKNNSTFNYDISVWNIASVTNMSEVFSGATAFNQDISVWDISGVTNTANMFNGATAFNQNLSQWNTQNVTDMQYMFNNATSLITFINAWNTAKVTNMSHMLTNVAAFNQDLSQWDTQLVTDMENMFKGTELNTSNYSKIINAWGSQLVVQNDVKIGADATRYSNTNDVVRMLRADYNWTFSDAGIEVDYAGRYDTPSQLDISGGKLIVENQIFNTVTTDADRKDLYDHITFTIPYRHQLTDLVSHKYHR